MTRHDVDGLARIATRNNVEWCDIMCRAHGLEGRFDADSWWLAGAHRRITRMP